MPTIDPNRETWNRFQIALLSARSRVRGNWLNIAFDVQGHLFAQDADDARFAAAEQALVG